ncbi:unnamed protein product [Symbiodinium sp. KB8]|nr:unnamed protein product [Symbiodinium sp. KB8]
MYVPQPGPLRPRASALGVLLLCGSLGLGWRSAWVPGWGARQVGQGSLCNEGLWLDSYCAHGMRPAEPPNLLEQISAMGPPPWAFLPAWVQMLAPFVIIIVLGAVAPTFFGRALFGAPRDADLSEWLKQKAIEVEVTEGDRQRPDQ